MPNGDDNSCSSVFSVNPESVEELMRICRASYGVWENHLSTSMPALEISSREIRKMAPTRAVSVLFQLFCTSPARHVLLPQKLGGKRICEEYFCQPLAFVAYPDYHAAPAMRSADMVISERTGTSEELAFAFISVLKALGNPGQPSIIMLEQGGKPHFCTLLSIGENLVFADLSSGVFAQVGADFMDAVASGRGLFGGILSKFGIGGDNVRADIALSGLYKEAFPDFGSIKVQSIFRGEEALAFLWHYQAAKRLARPFLGEDLMRVASENPGAISRMKAASGADYSQVENALSCALDAFSRIPQENSAQIAPLAENARKALAALKN